MTTFQQLLKIKDLNQLNESRKQTIKEITEFTRRDLIIYAVDFRKRHPLVPNSIDFTDKTPFSDLIENLDDKNVDVVIHSPGGSAEAVKALVGMLRDKFEHIRFFIPNLAKSAATMMVLSGDEIFMDDRSELGPIDPQILIGNNYVPAQAVLDAFEKAKETILKSGPEVISVYLPLLDKYDLHILQICENALNLSKKLVKTWLSEYMFKDKSEKEREELSSKIADDLANHRKYLSHANPIRIKEAQGLGLKITDLRNEPALRDKIWQLYCIIELLFDRSPFVKLYENNKGTLVLKQLPRVKFVGVPRQPQAPPNNHLSRLNHHNNLLNNFRT